MLLEVLVAHKQNAVSLYKGTEHESDLLASNYNVQANSGENESTHNAARQHTKPSQARTAQASPTFVFPTKQ